MRKHLVKLRGMKGTFELKKSLFHRIRWSSLLSARQSHIDRIRIGSETSEVAPASVVLGCPKTSLAGVVCVGWRSLSQPLCQGDLRASIRSAPHDCFTISGRIASEPGIWYRATEANIG